MKGFIETMYFGEGVKIPSITNEFANEMKPTALRTCKQHAGLPYMRGCFKCTCYIIGINGRSSPMILEPLEHFEMVLMGIELPAMQIQLKHSRKNWWKGKTEHHEGGPFLVTYA